MHSDIFSDRLDPALEQSMSLSSATTVLVLAGTGYNPRRRRYNRLLHSEKNSNVVAHLADIMGALGDEPHAWMEWPAVSLVFLDGNITLAEYGVLCGSAWVRTPTDGDRAVLRFRELGSWLASVGAARW